MLEPDEISSDDQAAINQPLGPRDAISSEEPEGDAAQPLAAFAAADQPLGPRTK
jgi:hypothetical protein